MVEAGELPRAIGTAAGAGAVFARPGFVDGEGAALKGLVVQGFDGGVAAFLHFNEAEPAALAGFPVDGDFRARDLAEFGAHGGQFFFGSGEPDVADEQLLHETSSAARRRPPKQCARPAMRRRERRRERSRPTRRVQKQHRFNDPGHGVGVGAQSGAKKSQDGSGDQVRRLGRGAAPPYTPVYRSLGMVRAESGESKAAALHGGRYGGRMALLRGRHCLPATGLLRRCFEAVLGRCYATGFHQLRAAGSRVCVVQSQAAL